MESKKSLLDIIESIAKIIGSLIIPLVIFYLGNQFNQEQKNTHQENINLDRFVKIFKSLSSENEKEKEYAIKICSHLHDKDKLPSELFSIIETISEESNSSIEIAKGSRLIIEKEQRKNPNNQIKDLNPIVYIQISEENLRRQAKNVQVELRNNNFLAPGIELKRDMEYFDKNEIRYYSESDEIPNKIKTILKKTTGEDFYITKIDLDKNNPVKSTQFEIWFKQLSLE